MMDQTDRKILDIIQKEIPIVPNAFEVVAQKAAIDKDDVINRIKRLKENGIIRRIGGSFDSTGLGYYSVLVAAKVAEEDLEQTVTFLNRFTGVTHNYQRNHEYNLWFTFTASSKQRVEELIEFFKQKTGAQEMIPLPSLQKFKIKVHFKMTEDK
ncbi:MAG TPA: Lrp/AsnC family transcriptional regulator [Bacteroidetes bacterium]|nr:Lrp/AsnC family transcriptional regulator [Bacteroidota bacterium]